MLKRVMMTIIDKPPIMEVLLILMTLYVVYKAGIV